MKITVRLAKGAHRLGYKLGYIIGAAAVGFRLAFWHASNRKEWRK